MRRTFLLGAGFFLFLFISSATSFAFEGKGYALVYRGIGSCSDGCSEAAAEVAARLGYPIRYVTTRMMDGKADVFKDAVVWIQPGGNAIKAAKALGKRRLAMIREFVENGGGYLGFCAGAFLTDANVADEGELEGLGIIPWPQAYFPVFTNGNGTILRLNWRGNARHLYFNGGGTFKIPSNNRHPVEIIASYDVDGQSTSPAALQTSYGRGRVVVTGAHPEATYSWRAEDLLQDPDGLDYDLAEEMVRRALGVN